MKYHLSLLALMVLALNHTFAQNNLKSLKKGVYLTYADFFNNTPSLIDSIIIDSVKRSHKNWDTTYNFKVKKINSNRRLKVWGFSDGVNAFIYFQEEAFLLDFKDNEYSFLGYGLPKPRKANPYIDFTGNTTNGGLEDIYYFFDDRKRIKTPSLYLLDNNTGRVKHKEYGFVYGTGHKKCKLILYRVEEGEIGDSIKFSVGEQKFSYVPYSYDELVLDVIPEPLKVCTENGNKCIEVDLTMKKEWYFKISNQSLITDIIEVSKTEGDFDSFTCEKKQKKRLKDNPSN